LLIAAVIADCSEMTLADQTIELPAVHTVETKEVVHTVPRRSTRLQIKKSAGQVRSKADFHIPTKKPVVHTVDTLVVETPADHTVETD